MTGGVDRLQGDAGAEGFGDDQQAVRRRARQLDEDRRGIAARLIVGDFRRIQPGQAGLQGTQGFL